MEAGPLGQPGTNLGVLVGAVVIHDQVEVQVLGDGLLDLAQETQKFLMAMAWLAPSDHLAGGHIQRREQGCGAVTDVVVSDALDVPQPHGQQRLSPVQGLDLRLLVNAEHHRLVWRVQVETNDVADFVDKEWIG